MSVKLSSEMSAGMRLSEIIPIKMSEDVDTLSDKMPEIRSVKLSEKTLERMPDMMSQCAFCQ